MHITASAISLNVADVSASAEWATRHLGFEPAMAADGFASLAHPDAGYNLIYLATGLPTFKPDSAAGPADGLLVVFTVDDVDAEHARMVAEDRRLKLAGYQVFRFGGYELGQPGAETVLNEFFDELHSRMS